MVGIVRNLILYFLFKFLERMNGSTMIGCDRLTKKNGEDLVFGIALALVGQRVIRAISFWSMRRARSVSYNRALLSLKPEVPFCMWGPSCPKFVALLRVDGHQSSMVTHYRGATVNCCHWTQLIRTTIQWLKQTHCFPECRKRLMPKSTCMEFEHNLFGKFVLAI